MAKQLQRPLPSPYIYMYPYHLLRCLCPRVIEKAVLTLIRSTSSPDCSFGSLPRRCWRRKNHSVEPCFDEARRFLGNREPRRKKKQVSVSSYLGRRARRREKEGGWIGLMDRKGGSDQRSTHGPESIGRTFLSFLVLSAHFLWASEPSIQSSIHQSHQTICDQTGDKARKTDGCKNLKPADGKPRRLPAPLLCA